MRSGYPTPLFLQGRRGWRRRVALQHFGADLAGRDLAQRDHGRLVAVRLDQRRGAGAELSRAIRRGESELEAVADALEAVVNGDSGPWGLALSFRMIAASSSPGGFEVFVNDSVFELADVG